MQEMEVIAIGSDVLIDGEIPAKIMAFEVRGEVGLVTYQCAWWDERSRKSEWLTEGEIKPANGAHKTIRITPKSPSP
jgi:uncharacterized protein YodC (DUF2158 family)